MKDPVVMDDLIIVSRNEHGGDPRAPPPAYSGFQLVALDKESGMIVWRHSLGAWVRVPAQWLLRLRPPRACTAPLARAR